MQVVGALLGQAGGVGDLRGNIRTLTGRHCIKNINTLVDHKGFSKVEGEKILMNIRELAVKVQKILVIGSVAQNRGGELFSAVHGIVQGEGQLPLTDILLHIVDVVKFQNTCEIMDGPIPDGLILGGEQCRLAAVGDLPAVHHRVQAGDGIALGGIILGELFHIFFCQGRVLLGSPAQLDGIGPGCLVDFTALGQLRQVVGVGHIVEIAIFFPFAVLIGGLCVVGSLAEHRIRRENQLAVHEGKDHNHDNDQHDRNREDAANESV